MFEKTNPPIRELDGHELDNDMLVGSHDNVPARSGGALRAIEWGELTAKLNAARDFRRVLNRDRRLNIEVGSSSFGDAAATYFRGLEQGQRSVNPDGLEPGKASNAIDRELHEDAAHGDTRDDG